MSTSPSIEHPSLGQIHGTKPPRLANVDQYLGIQYATLANRFARGTLVETRTSSSPLTATKIGPLPVADPENCAREHLLLQHALPFEKFHFSDTECLTLNVSVPAGLDPKSLPKQLPVVAFVHGGGFVTGSANWPQYDLGPLVERSVKVGKPVIAVGINYRLGPFGFLTSSAMREAGFLPNNGVHDQKLALRWIQKHIQGFGGDPTQVTYLGSSMGAASAFFHLQSEEPLFTAAAALGGNPLIQPLPLAVGDVAFDAITSHLGLGGLAGPERVQALLDIPAEELSAKLAGVQAPLNAVLDGDIIKQVPSYAGLAAFARDYNKDKDEASSSSSSPLFPGAGWCRTVLVGDSQLDGMVMDVTVLSHRPDNLAETLTRSLATTFASSPADSDGGVPAALAKAYGIDAADYAQTKNKLPVIHFINDIIFAQGAKAAAQTWASLPATANTRGYLSHFNLPNPWPGAWQHHATHALDIVVLLGTYNAYLAGAGQRACAEHMTDDFLRLAHGEEPFPPLRSHSGQPSSSSSSMVYAAGVDSDKDESRVASEADAGSTARRRVLEDVTGGKPEVLDQVLAACGLFMQGGPK